MKDERNIITREGYQAALNNVGNDENPYFEYSSRWSWWADGWHDGMITKSQAEPRGMWQAFDKEQVSTTPTLKG